ncbi:HD domain-containing protein [Candidatus Poribacteria bacterium]|nr:HD domain-containing protein [Candidatus Poribacteria bacterium]
MDYKSFRENAIELMLNRGWKEKTAKKWSFEQSLFDHTLIEIDALIVLLPLLRQSFAPPFTEQEEQALLIAALLHDVGKEPDKWQDYIQGKGGFVSDVDRELAKEVVPEVVKQFGFSGIEEILSAIVLHMRRERSNAKVINRLLFGGHTNARWKMLADIVDAVDNLCSCKGLFSALNYLSESSCLSNHLKTAYHLVRIRGVSTTMLHRSAINMFMEKGWIPLLHYSNGTIYVVSGVELPQEPTLSDIESEFSEVISKAMQINYADHVVGSPVQSMMPKPDLFDYCEIQLYLCAASKLIGRGSFMKKTPPKKREVVSKYLFILENFKDQEMVPKSAVSDARKRWKSGQRVSADDEEIELHAARISAAQPEMCIFKFLKAALSEDMLGTEVTPEAAENYSDFAEAMGRKKTLTVTPQSVAKAEYDAVFGKGAYDALRYTSTLMPDQDMALTVSKFWSISGEKFGLDVSTIGNLLDDKKREEILIETLTNIADKVYSAIPEANRPTRISPEDIASSLIVDLIHPVQDMDMETLVNKQINAYGGTKANARKDKGLHICPICNQTFDGGTKAKADFVDNPEGHTNRGISHGSSGAITICDSCKYELFLQQIILGSQVTDMLVLFPRMNIGHANGEILQRKAIDIWESANMRMSEANPDPDRRLSLGMIYNLARKLSDYEIFRLTPSEIVELITYESASHTKKKYRKELINILKDFYGMDELIIEELNDEWGTDFDSVDEALAALIADRVNDSEARRLKAQAFRLSSQFHIVCQTPNMILIPLANPITMGKESDTNSGIRELYITLFLGLALDCSVTVVRSGESITFEGGEGVARVPSVPALRELIGADWVTIKDSERDISAKEWLDAIGAAALIANSTDFPERSNLYQILKSATAGYILRRIEQKSESGQAYIHHFQLLEKLKGVLR